MPFVNVLPEAKVYDRKYSPQSMHIYARLITKNIFLNVCKKCKKSVKGYHRHIHHRNGNVYDNRIENLELLCAYCHDKETYPNGHGGWKMSKEQKKKISIANKGKRLGMKFSEKWKENIRKGHIGLKLSDDHREAIRISHVGVKFFVYHCRRISEGKKKAFLGRRLQRF